MTARSPSLLREWDLLQDQVVPPLLDLDRGRVPCAWSIGSLEDAVSIGVAYRHAMDARGTDTDDGASCLDVFVDAAGATLTEVGFSTADLGHVPAQIQEACFVQRSRRWVADESIAEHVLLGEPHQFVDLITLRDEDSGQGLRAADRLLDHALSALHDGGQLVVPGDGPVMRLPGLQPVASASQGRVYAKSAGHTGRAPSAAVGTRRSPEIQPRPESLARRRTEEELVQDHIRLAKWLAKRFAHRGEPIEELEQVAMLALVKAAKRFDPARETRFATYASTSILGELKRHFRDKVWALRVPRPTQELYLEVKHSREELTHELNATPTNAQIADHLGTTEAAVREAVDAGSNFWPTSLDGRSGDDSPLDIPGPDTWLEQTLDLVHLEKLLPNLEPREILILRRIYFDDCTQREVASEIGVSQMQVSRLLARALAKLRA